MGDPSGIGREILLCRRKWRVCGNTPQPVRHRRPGPAQSLAQDLELDLVIQPIDNPAMARSPSGGICRFCPDGCGCRDAGRTHGGASAVIESIELATRLCSREISAVVTNPIRAFSSSRISISGTYGVSGSFNRYRYAARDDGGGSSLRVVPVTIHWVWPRR